MSGAGAHGSSLQRAGRLVRALGLAALALGVACASGPRPGAVAVSGELSPDAVLAAVDGGAGVPAHLVLVSVAGLVPALYLDEPTPMPVLAALAASGVAAERVETVAPAAPYPVHATLVTGRSPRDHGVAADQVLGDRGVRRDRASHASELEVPTLWQRVAEAGGVVAALDWPTTLGAAIPLLAPDVVPVRPGETWSALVAQSASPALAALLADAPSQVDRPGAARDAWLTEAACTVLRSPNAPRLVLLRLTQTDAALVRSGSHGAPARAAFAGADAQIARLLACLAESDALERAAIAVAGDRPLLPVHTALRPNASLAAGGLVRVDRVGGVSAWRALARSNGGSAFVYARDAEAALEARSILEAEARRGGAFRVVSAEEMIARQADPRAWFGLEAEPGFVFLDGAVGAPEDAARARAAGGYLTQRLAARDDLAAGFVAFGRGVRRGIRVPEMSQLDVAPTLAVLLGVSLGDEVGGRRLTGLLRPAPSVAAPPDGEAALDAEAPWQEGGGEGAALAR